MGLRYYQEAAVNKARDALRRGVKRIIIYGPTGSGKTEIGIRIMQLAKELSKSSSFVCNRIALVKQASMRLKKSQLPHGIIQGQNSVGTKKDVLVCSIQTLARRGYPPSDVILIDEAHGATSQAYVDFVKANLDKPIIGLSATPFTRGLGKQYDWGALFEEVIISATIPELIRDGYLVDCDIYAPSGPDLKNLKEKINEFGERDFDQVQAAKRIHTPVLVGETVENWFAMAYGLPTIVFAHNIAHSKAICEEFRAMGVSAEHIDHHTDKKEEADILARYELGEVTVLCNVYKYAEGWDSPRCACMVNAHLTKSLTKWIQKCGRTLRPFPGKDRALIIDQTATAHLLGYPTDDLPLELDDGAPRGAATRSDEAPIDAPKVWVCPSCHYLVPSGVFPCPKCGCVPKPPSKVKTIEGKLTKLERKHQFVLEHKQEIWSGCLGLAEKRKKSRGWASHLYKSIAGVWPSGVADTPGEPSKIVLDMDVSNRIRYAKRRTE